MIPAVKDHWQVREFVPGVGFPLPVGSDEPEIPGSHENALMRFRSVQPVQNTEIFKQIAFGGVDNDFVYIPASFDLDVSLFERLDWRVFFFPVNAWVDLQSDYQPVALLSAFLEHQDVSGVK